MTRDERQSICVNNWLKAGGKGTIVAPTGLGKTRIALICLKKVIGKYPSMKAMVVVPTTNLREQWEGNLIEFGLNSSVTVHVINSAVMQEWKTDILVLDEIHTMASKLFYQIFLKVKYRLILGLTATFERLDGKHELISKHCPVIDTITLADTIINHWIAEYVEYQVLLNVDNIEEYQALQHENTGHFEYFNFNYDLIMKLVGKGGFEARKEYTNLICIDKRKWSETFKAVTFHAMGFMRTMQAKKMFINNHSKKVEIARKIIEARPYAKILTFSNNIKMAEAIGYGKVYSGKDTKKHSTKVLEQFENDEIHVLNSSKKLVAGADIKNLNLEIILGQDSSVTRATQTRGRAIRLEGDKTSEIFNLVINNSQDCTWFKNSHKGAKYVTIDEENLYKVLNYEPFDTYKKPISQFNYRF